MKRILYVVFLLLFNASQAQAVQVTKVWFAESWKGHSFETYYQDGLGYIQFFKCGAQIGPTFFPNSCHRVDPQVIKPQDLKYFEQPLLQALRQVRDEYMDALSKSKWNRLTRAFGMDTADHNLPILDNLIENIERKGLEAFLMEDGVEKERLDSSKLALKLGAAIEGVLSLPKPEEAPPAYMGF